MIIVLPICRKDFDSALRNLAWVLHMHPRQQPFTCVIHRERNFSPPIASQVIAAAKRCFVDVRESLYPAYAGRPEWPWPQNYAFKWAALAMVRGDHKQPWFWWEQDAVPLHPDAFIKVRDEYLAAGKPFMGTRGASEQFEPASHIMGVAVYPWEAARFFAPWLQPNHLPFDVRGGAQVLNAAHQTSLIQHIWCWDKVNAPATPPSFTSIETLRKVSADAVFFHRCKDSTLIDRLMEQESGVSDYKRERPTFYHSGAMGDVIYGLYAIKKAFGGRLALGNEQRGTAPPRKPIDPETFEFLRPLLYQQPYIDGLTWMDRHPGIAAKDLNQFRNHWYNPEVRAKGIHLLAQAHCYALGLHEYFDHAEQWLYVPDHIQIDRYIVNRTHRYRNQAFNWRSILDRLGPQNLLFIGTDQEHASFTAEVGPIERHKAKDALELARMLAGCNGFIGNQSFICAVAIGLGQRVIQEASPVSPDCLFERKNLIAYQSGGFISDTALEEWKTSELAPANGQEVIADIVSAPLISIVVFNRLDMTRRCLSLLARHTPKFHLVITDNASTDGTREFLDGFSSAYPGMCTIVRNAHNAGFQAPNEKVFGEAMRMKKPPEFFVMVNNDVEIGPGWWQRIESMFGLDPKLAIVGSSVGTCGKLTPDFHGKPITKQEQPEYVEGSLMAVRTAIVSKLGLFDPHLQFMYGEDSDLSLRVREAGYKIATADLNSRHLVNQTLRSVGPDLRAKIKQAQASNHEYLKRRWRVYLKTRNFRYTVLLNRRAAVGDVIDVTAVIPLIHEKWPEAWISVQTDCPEVFIGNPSIRHAGPSVGGDFDYRFDLDLSYEKQPDKHTLEAYCEVCELNPCLERARPVLYASIRDEDFARRTLPDGSRYVAIHAAPSWRGKEWPVDRWSSLISDMAGDGLVPVLVGGDANWELGSYGIDLRGKTTIPGLYAVIQRCAAFVGIDSAPSHIAQAAGCPAVVLFGTVLAERKLFPACKTAAVQADQKKVPCVGLHHRLKPPVTYSDCDGSCMRAISVEMVKSRLGSILSK